MNVIIVIDTPAMPITKKDLSQIKGAVHEEVERAVETLATVVTKAFTSVQKQIELLDKRVDELTGRITLIEKRIERVEGELRHINARLDTIEHDITDIRGHFVYRDEFNEVLKRLSLLEKKVGVRGSVK